MAADERAEIAGQRLDPLVLGQQPGPGSVGGRIGADGPQAIGFLGQPGQPGAVVVNDLAELGALGRGENRVEVPDLGMSGGVHGDTRGRKEWDRPGKTQSGVAPWTSLADVTDFGAAANTATTVG